MNGCNENSNVSSYKKQQQSQQRYGIATRIVNEKKEEKKTTENKELAANGKSAKREYQNGERDRTVREIQIPIMTENWCEKYVKFIVWVFGFILLYIFAVRLWEKPYIR